MRTRLHAAIAAAVIGAMWLLPIGSDPEPLEEVQLAADHAVLDLPGMEVSERSDTTQFFATPEPTPVPTPVPTPAPPAPAPAVQQVPQGEGWPWIALADCESGDGDGRPPYTARWAYNGPSGFDGGLQFLPSTWRRAWAVAAMSGPAGYAYQHPPDVQIHVAKAWLEVTSWRQWPECSRKLGLR